MEMVPAVVLAGVKKVGVEVARRVIVGVGVVDLGDERGSEIVQRIAITWIVLRRPDSRQRAGGEGRSVVGTALPVGVQE
jgi:hypothetical protein